MLLSLRKPYSEGTRKQVRVRSRQVHVVPLKHSKLCALQWGRAADRDLKRFGKRPHGTWRGEKTLWQCEGYRWGIFTYWVCRNYLEPVSTYRGSINKKLSQAGEIVRWLLRKFEDLSLDPQNLSKAGYGSMCLGPGCSHSEKEGKDRAIPGSSWPASLETYIGKPQKETLSQTR